MPSLRLTRRRLAAVLACGAALRGAGAATPSAQPGERAALTTPRALGAVLLGIAGAGTRLVAVGERGVVLLSDDAGQSWRQVPTPVSTTLVAVRFLTPQLGLAAGHAGVVLRTTDGGQTWERRLDGRAAAALAQAEAAALPAGTPAAQAALANAQRLRDDGPDKPWLALQGIDAQNAWALGAYGLLARTADGGQTWQSVSQRLDNPKALHLNAIAAQGQTLVIAGEGGQVWRSDDGGEKFTRLTSPYQGSWFAAVLLASGRLVLGGLRGNVFFSDDRGASFTRASLPTPVTVSALLPLRDGRLLALTQAGDVAASSDRGAGFQPLALPPGAPLTDLIETDDGTLVAASFRGPRRLAAAAPASR